MAGDNPDIAQNAQPEHVGANAVMISRLLSAKKSLIPREQLVGTGTGPSHAVCLRLLRSPRAATPDENQWKIGIDRMFPMLGTIFTERFVFSIHYSTRASGNGSFRTSTGNGRRRRTLHSQ